MAVRLDVLIILLATSQACGCKEFCWERVVVDHGVETYEAITGCGDGTIYAAGDGVVRRTHEWSKVRSSPGWGIKDVWCSARDDVFIVHLDGYVSHYDGNEWTRQAENTADWSLLTVWGSAPDNVFAGGENNERAIILHYDGMQWTETYTGTEEGRILSIWGSSGEDVYAAGYEGECRLWRLSGSEWVRVTDYTLDSCADIWGSAGDDIYIAGGNGFAHYDGAEWAEVETNTGRSYSRLCGTAFDDVYALESMYGESVLYYNGDQWRDISDESLEGRDLNDIWVTPKGKIYIAAALWARYYPYGAVLGYTCR